MVPGRSRSPCSRGGTGEHLQDVRSSPGGRGLLLNQLYWGLRESLSVASERLAGANDFRGARVTPAERCHVRFEPVSSRRVLLSDCIRRQIAGPGNQGGGQRMMCVKLCSVGQAVSQEAGEPRGRGVGSVAGSICRQRIQGIWFWLIRGSCWFRPGSTSERYPGWEVSKQGHPKWKAVPVLPAARVVRERLLRLRLPVVGRALPSPYPV